MPDAFHIETVDTGNGVPCQEEKSAPVSQGMQEGFQPEGQNGNLENYF